MDTVTPQSAEQSARNFATGAASTATHAIESTRSAAASALDSAQASVSELSEKIPAKVGEAATAIDKLVRDGIERARAGCCTAKEKMDAASARTVTYVRDEPVKAVLIAAASGALLAGALALLGRSRRP